MPRLIKPGQVTVLTQDGEVQVTIVLELNINLNSEGISASVRELKTEEKAAEKKHIEEIPNWEIPNFENKNKIKFGKKE
ncbi:MAG: hypothetical protein EKK64_03235 [Neisseriaceae bacterium]|nr:MAG: hypothetical protein EKK64_03235 [Neisseriaceae bacterium]